MKVVIGFSADDPRLMTAVGEKVGDILRLRSSSGVCLFGPYIDLPAGPCVARIHFAGPASGLVIADIFAAGAITIASRFVDLATLQGGPLEVVGHLHCHQPSCEVRLMATTGVDADISGLEIEVVDFPAASAPAGAGHSDVERLSFLFTAMLMRPPTAVDFDSLLPVLRTDPAEVVSMICGAPEFVMKHPRFIPRPMTESLVAANVNGIDMLVPNNDWVHWDSVRGQDYEPWVAAALRRRLGPGSVFLDIGANTGVMTMLGASLVGDTGRVYAVEASIDNAAVILANMRHCGFANTVILPIAVSDRKGTERISVDHGGSNKIVRPVEETAGWKHRFEPIAVDTLDSLLSHVDRLDLVKIDIEGREGAALRGAADLLARTRPSIIGEYHANSPEAWYADELVGRNYEVTILARDGSVLDLGRDIGALKRAGTRQLGEHGICLEVLFTPTNG